MLYVVLIVIGIVGIFIAAISDIKTREIPDWLNYSLISLGLGIRIIYSISLKDPLIIFSSVIGLIIAFILGLFMYYTKQWGGGDAKSYMAIASLFTSMPDQKFFLFDFTVNLLIVGSIYTILMSIYYIFQKKLLTKIKISFSNKIKKITIIFLVSFFMALFVYFLDVNFIIPVLLLILVLFFYLFVIPIIKIVETSLIKTISVKNLTEGDWITENIYLKNKFIYNNKSPGVTKKQISQILKSKIKNLKVKEGIVFMPSFFITLIVTLLFNNLIYYLF